MDIPVYIVNRNRLTSTRLLVDWLLAVGTTEITIIDNASSYPPLLDYYDNLPMGVSVFRTGENLGPWCFWGPEAAYGGHPELLSLDRLAEMSPQKFLQLHKQQSRPYIYTDSDCVPSADCPKDLIDQLYRLLLLFSDAGKVGAGLRIDNIPEHYNRRSHVIDWETNNLLRTPTIPFFGAEFCPVDTTFALYPAYGEFTCGRQNVRTVGPYLVEHLPWYEDSSNLSEEEQYYMRHTYNWWLDK